MGNVVSQQKSNQIGHYGSSLPQHEQDRHRAWIGVRVEALLDGYWDRRPSDAVKLEILQDWMDVLAWYSPVEIRDACRRWMTDKPRTKPNPGDIRGLIMDERGRLALLSKKPEPPPEPPVDYEARRKAAAEILRQAGFARAVGGEAAE